jgi:hypothetical protein
MTLKRAHHAIVALSRTARVPATASVAAALGKGKAANKRCQEPFAARGGELVYLVCLVCLVCLVYLVSLVSLVSFNKSNKVNQTN